MRKLVLSLCMAALGLLALANVAFAADGSVTASSMVDVRATDIVSGGQGVWVAPWVRDLTDRWQRAYGWTPSKKITVSLYGTGYGMANDYAAFRGSALTDSETRDVTNFEGAFALMDMRPAASGGTGGWIVLVNLASGRFGTGAVGTGNWMNEVKGAIVMQLAAIMMTDISGSGGPTWMRVGMINYLAQSEVPWLNAISVRKAALASIQNTAAAPGLVALHNNWAGVIGMSAMSYDASLAISTLTVQYMVSKFGPMAVFTMLKQTSNGGNFESIFMSTTGMSIQQMDQTFRTVM